MPWRCGCGTEVDTDDQPCPSCSASKTQWTLVREQTRTFRLAAKKVELLRRDEAGELVEADAAPAVTKSVARAREGGAHPDALVVRLHPRNHPDLDITVEVGFELQEVHDVLLPRPRPDDLPDAAVVDVPLLLVHGPESVDGIVVEGGHVVDITEEGSERGFAPTISVRALKKPPKPLPVESPAAAGTRFVEDGTGQPVRGCFVYLAPPDADAFEPDETLFCDEEGVACRPVGGNVVQEGPPPADARVLLTPRPRRLHWSYVPVTDFAALTSKDVSTIEVAGAEVRLRPRIGKAPLVARLVQADPERSDPEAPGWVPVAGRPYRLQGDEPRPVVLEGTTDADGRLRHEDAPRVAYRLTIDGFLPALLHAGGDAETPPEVVLQPDVLRPLRVLARVVGILDEGEDELEDERDDDAAADEETTGDAEGADDEAPATGREPSADELAAMFVDLDDAIEQAPVAAQELA